MLVTTIWCFVSLFMELCHVQSTSIEEKDVLLNLSLQVVSSFWNLSLYLFTSSSDLFFKSTFMFFYISLWEFMCLIIIRFALLFYGIRSLRACISDFEKKQYLLLSLSSSTCKPFILYVCARMYLCNFMCLIIWLLVCILNWFI